MADTTIIITDLDSLEEWRSQIRRSFFPSIPPMALFDLQALAESGNQRFTHEAARLHRACGCASAGLAMTVAVLFRGLSIGLDPRGPGGVPLLGWAGYVLLVAAATALGKLAGLAWARRQMLHLAASVEALAGPPPQLRAL